MANERYLLDANVFIQASRQYYPFDIAPGFWTNLEEHARAGRVRSIDRVKSELLRGNDDLADWAKGRRFIGGFASTRGQEVVVAYTEIMTWVEAQPKFFDAAKAQFADCADGWLVAYAKAHGWIIVTHETYDKEVRKRVKIPNVCKAFQVEYVAPWDMLRVLGVKLC